MDLVSKESYPDIPVAQHRERILDAIKENQVVVVVGETGSGKTTQLPKMAIEYLQTKSRGETKPKLVGCTQPRRIAAASVAKRVAEELQVEIGAEVGYQVRFDDKTTKETQLKFMTDGILLAETQGDPSLSKYDFLIIDEAHERSLNIDFLLGYLKRLVTQRPDIRVLISSATLDAGAFADFFENTPIIQVEGRTFPVEVHYHPAFDSGIELAKHVVDAVQWVRGVDREGDILIFLPGEREIRECTELLESQAYARSEILPLYARLGLGAQQKVFRTINGVQRVVLATNVAETSLTIPGIVYVIDSGLARISRWNPARQVQRLQVEKISQASARQRMGRCGRVREGVCVRLYDEQDHDERDEYTDPEIRRSSLSGVILQMKSLKLPDIIDFPFIDPPSSKHISEGYRTLREIGALDSDHQLLKMGYQLARLPVEPRLGRMLIEAVSRDALAELLVIVAGLSVMDPRERPQDKHQQADQAHAKWKHTDSDFLSLLLLWKDLLVFKQGKQFQRNKLRKFCQKNFLNFRRVVEWDNLLFELSQLCRSALKFKVSNFSIEETNWAHDDEIHRAILAGIPRQIGNFDKKKKTYKGAQGKEFSIFPGSHLFGKKKCEWIIAYEMVDTTKLYARRVAKLKPQWVEEVAPHLCSKRWHSAEFDANQGVVYAKEVITCGNLTIVPARNVHYGRINPEAAREVFILEGLIEGKLKSKPYFVKQVEALRDEVEMLEQKLRRPEGIWSEELLIDWYKKHLPKDAFAAKTFINWAKKSELAPALEDVIYEESEELDRAGFPDIYTHEGEEYPLYYKTEPGEFDDGVTIGIHVDQLICFPDYLASWGVPGDREERVILLIRSLPKASRVACNPVAEKAKEFVSLWYGKEPKKSIAVELAQFLSVKTGLRITSDLFVDSKLPACMKMKFWVCDDEGNELAFEKDLAVIKNQLAEMTKTRFEDQSGAEWECSGMFEFDCDTLPNSIEMAQGLAYPALIDEGRSVGVKVFSEELEAIMCHRFGVIRLFIINYNDNVKYILKNLPLSQTTKLYLPVLGESGIDYTNILHWVIAHAFQSPLPRDRNEFNRQAELARGNLAQSASIVCQCLENIINTFRAIEEFIIDWKKDDNLSEIAYDVEEQVNWLLRAEFSKQTDVKTLMKYKIWFESILKRLQRATNSPLIKDLEKMDAILELWQPWYAHWEENKENLKFVKIGYLLYDLRSFRFNPEVKGIKNVSEKILKTELKKMFF